MNFVNTDLQKDNNKLDMKVDMNSSEFQRILDMISNSDLYKKEIHKLKEENKKLNKIIDKFKITIKRFIKWICNKFSYPSEDELIRDFEKETYTNFNFEKQLDIKNFKKREDDFDIEY